MKTNHIPRILGLFILMIVAGLPGAAPPAAAQQPPQRTCYQQKAVVTPLDSDCNWSWCQEWRERNTFGKQADGSITSRPKPGWGGGANWRVLVDQAKAEFTTDQNATMQYGWTIPPQVWCSDQSAKLTVSVAASGDSVLGGIRLRTSDVNLMSEWTVDGEHDPWGDGVISGGTSQGYVAPRTAAVTTRPKPNYKEWDIWVRMSSYHGEFEVHYLYTPIPPGQEPPPGGQQPPGGQPGGGGAGGAGGQPGSGNAGLCTINTSSGIVINAVDNDGENKLNECETLRVPFGDSAQDARRCFTFRYTVPPGGIANAALHVVLIPGQSLQDTDSVSLAIGQANPDCDWAKGKMPGCVTLHGGFRGDEQCMNLDLLNAGCDPSVKIPPEVQQAVTAQLQTGVLHFMLQDDTGIEGAQLVLNGGPRIFPCGTSTQPVGTGGTGGAGGTGGTGGTGGAGGATNTTLPTPPYGQSEPNTHVPGMTLQAGQRKVIAGEMALVPVWLIKAQNVANLNFDVQYDAYVARPEGTIQRGSLMDNTMLSTNPNELGVVRVGFARTFGLSGSGSVVYIPFRAEGQPGDRTPLTLAVTTINDPSGGVPAIDRINGEILIVGPEGLVPGDCDGDGWLTESDALCALEISVKLRPVLTALDLDSSGDVTSRDATLILLRALGRR